MAFPFTKTINISTLFSAFERVYAPDFYFSGESHNFWEFVCVLDGCAGVTADNNVYTLSKNQFILHPPMEFHRIWSAQGSHSHVIIMSFAADLMPPLDNYIYRLGTSALQLILKLNEDANRIFHFDDHGLVLRPQATALELEIFLKNLEIFLLTVLSGSAPSNSRDHSASANYYRRIVKTMEENLTQRLSVDDIAEQCKMSKSNLKKTFAQYSGEGVIKHFNDMKVKAAIPLLLEGRSISEISRHFGFEEQSYFSTVFKRITGLSPANYVKRHK